MLSGLRGSQATPLVVQSLGLQLDKLVQRNLLTPVSYWCQAPLNLQTGSSPVVV